MKTIEQSKTSNIEIDIRNKESIAWLFQCGDEVGIDKKGAAELIKVLQEWVAEPFANENIKIVHESFQPDWSQAPDWAKYWTIDFCGFGRWYSSEPKKYIQYYQGSINTLEQRSPDFGYNGTWEESLRKRP